MGYEMSLRKQNFFIKKEYKQKALELLKELCRHEKIRWVSSLRVTESKTLEEAIQECCWKLMNDSEGNVIGIRFEMEKLGDEYKIFNAIAPAVEEDSFIEMCGGDGDIWRWIFKNRKCKEIRPKTEW